MLPGEDHFWLLCGKIPYKSSAGCLHTFGMLGSVPGKREKDELPDEDHQRRKLAERDWVSCYQLSFDIRCQHVHTCWVL